MKKENHNSIQELSLAALSHPRLDVPITVFRGTHAHPERHLTLRELFAEIITLESAKLNHSKSILFAYEQYLILAAENKPQAKAAYNDLKNNLNGFLMGHFTYRANDKINCAEYVPCLVFDLDSCVSPYQAFELQQKLQELDYVFSVFPSPSGHGLRVMVWTSSTYETHRIVYKQVLSALCAHLNLTTDRNKGIHFDATCENESRHFYYVAISGQNFYLNLESKVVELDSEKKVISPSKKTFSIEKQDIYTYIDEINDAVKIDFILKSIDMNKPRKLQCFDFGCRCSENNVPFEMAKTSATSHFYDSEQKNPEKIIENQLKDGYEQTTTRYTDEQFAAYLLKTHQVKVINSSPKQEATEFSTAEKTKNLTIDEYRQIRRARMPSKSMNAQIKNYLKHHYEFRRNIVANTIEYCVHGVGNWETLREFDLIDELLDESFKSVEQSLTAFLGSSQVPDYDPFIGYFESLPKWDGVDHIGKLANYVTAYDKMWWYTMFKKALVRNCACATGVVHYNKQCLVLFGGTNAGKSMFIRFLVPPALKNYFNENSNIANRDDKDARLSIAKNFITNLDDVGNIREADLRELKSTFSKESVNERLIYDRGNTTMVRRTTFWGTADKEEFLIDEQGNVRWVIIRIKSILHEEGGKNGYTQMIDIDKVWAQVYHLLNNGFKFGLTKEEIEYSEKNNKENYMKISLEEELILQYYTPAKRTTENAVFLTTTNIALRLETFSPKTTLRNVGIALTKLGYEKVRSTINGKDTKGYFVIKL